MNATVSTRNPRVGAHVSPELNNVIEAYMARTASNQSDAVRTALAAFYGVKPELIEKLGRIAEENKRTVGDQAAILLGAAIQSAGETKN